MKNNIVGWAFLMIFVALIGLGVWGSIDKQKTQSKIEDLTEKEEAFDIKKQPLIGKEDAKVELTIFYDYACNHCADWEAKYLPDVEKMIEENDNIAIRFVNYQFLSENSNYAGMGGEMIHEKSPEKFLEYTKYMMENQNKLSRGMVVKQVKKALPEISEKEIEATLDSQIYMSKLNVDKAYATSKGVSATPALLINDTLIENAFDMETVKKEINKQLKEKVKE